MFAEVRKEKKETRPDNCRVYCILAERHTGQSESQDANKSKYIDIYIHLS